MYLVDGILRNSQLLLGKFTFKVARSTYGAFMFKEQWAY